MGLLSFIRNQLIEIVEWLDDSNYTLVHRFPDQDHEIKNGATLVCRPGQAAILVGEGKLADVFGPGTHTLVTQNLPILSSLRGWASGFESPFKVEIYFINLKQYLDQRWGTATPILIRDEEFGVGGRPGRIPLRAYGSYNFRIHDPKLFFEEVVGTDGHVTTDDIERHIKAQIVSSFGRAASSASSQKKIGVMDMAAHTDLLADAVRSNIADELAKLGLTLTSFIVESVSLPPNIQKAIEEAAAQAARGVDQTMGWEALQAMKNAAANPGGGGDSIGAGMGMGMGMGMGQMMQQMFQGNSNANPQPAQAPQNSLQDKLQKLKAAFDAGLLTDDEYSTKKNQILADF